MKVVQMQESIQKQTYIVVFLERFEYLWVFTLVLYEEKSCPITSFSKFLMNLLCRQSQNLCPKNAKPVFAGCRGRVFFVNLSCLTCLEGKYYANI